MRKNLLFVLLLAFASFYVGRVYAQSGSVIFLGAIPGTTKAANCGTPTTPSMCIVGDGVWIWQSAAAGWVLAGAQGATGPQGAQGIPGPQGATGPTGPAGQASTNAVQSVNGKTGVVVLSVQ